MTLAGATWGCRLEITSQLHACLAPGGVAGRLGSAGPSPCLLHDVDSRLPTGVSSVRYLEILHVGSQLSENKAEANDLLKISPRIGRAHFAILYWSK